MPKTIQQTVKFKVKPEKLYDIYMDSKMHSDAIGAPVKISKKVGGAFSSHGKYIIGKNLVLVPKKMIVQTWRGSDWTKKDLDSILTLTFNKVAGGSELVMVHNNVPDKHAKGITGGWNDYYWKLWKLYVG